MAQEIYCRSIDQSPPYDDCRCIDYVRFMANGASHKASPQLVYEHIVEEGREFYVEHGGEKTEVVPVESDNGDNYIRTAPNDTENDNLLHIDSCS